MADGYGYDQRDDGPDRTRRFREGMGDEDNSRIRAPRRLEQRSVRQTTAAPHEFLRTREMIVGHRDDPETNNTRMLLGTKADNVYIRIEEYDGTDWQFKFIIKWDGSTNTFLVPQTGAPQTAQSFLTLGESEDPLLLEGDFDIKGRFGLVDVVGSPRTGFASLPDGDTTPDISGRIGWKTNNSSPTTITAFDSADNSDDLKEVFFLKIGDNNTTIDFSSSQLEGNRGVSKTLQQGDFLLCVRMGGDTAPDDLTICAVWSDELELSDVQSELGISKTTSGVETNMTSGDSVTHGLGTTPDIVLITPMENHTGPAYVDNITSTTFDVNGLGAGGTDVMWMAISTP